MIKIETKSAIPDTGGPEKMGKQIISPRNKEFLRFVAEETIERMCVMSEGEKEMTEEVLAASLLRSLKNHGVRSMTEDYIVEILPMIDEAIAKLKSGQPEKKFKKGFSGLIKVLSQDKSAPDIVTIESMGISISLRSGVDEHGKKKLEEIDRRRLDGRGTDPETIKFPPEIYAAILRTAWGVLSSRKKGGRETAA